MHIHVTVNVDLRRWEGSSRTHLCVNGTSMCQKRYDRKHAEDIERRVELCRYEAWEDDPCPDCIGKLDRAARTQNEANRRASTHLTQEEHDVT